MSVAFAAPRQRGKGEITPAAIQKMLDENNHLIQCIMDYQNKGKTSECSQYQQMLHTNLVYLATIADSNQNMQSLLPASLMNSPVVKVECDDILFLKENEDSAGKGFRRSGLKCISDLKCKEYSSVLRTLACVCLLVEGEERESPLDS
ncbi:hypothetical protein WISP_15114 [Willisornis vidua]|uniref:SS18 N-terminal domain-containing protein n=1 Tax=Willisornis vidua TaxID=1566151 RepID=A0ABQ9DVH0_9PASS|nr:hypothetical protein WISP_15114 [Willisornis vidua]